MKKVFNYLRDLWEGTDGKLSLRAVAAIILLIDFVSNTSHAVYKWDTGRSFEGLSLLLGIEAGLITACMGITAWTNISAKKIEADTINPPQPTPIITVQKAETVTSGTKAEVVNADKVATVNSQTTNIAHQEPSDAK